MIYQISIFLLSFLLSLVFVYLFKKISEKTGLALDISDGGVLKIHTKKTSLLGGAGFVLSFLVSLIIFVFTKDFGQVITISTGIILIFLFGFFDDTKWKGDEKHQKIKLVSLLVCSFLPAIFLHFSGISFNFLPFGFLPLILSFIYIFGSINCINYQDGIDGLASGLVLISLIGFFVLGFVSGNTFVVSISVIIFACLLGFWIFNFPPAKIFMGDSGAYSLGFILAVLAMIFCRPYDIFSVLAPLLVIGVPFFDGIFTNIRKLASKQSLLAGDRMFYYDRLMKKYSIKKVLFISYSIQAVFVFIGIIIYFC